jgi:hypothetical protein
MIMAAAGGVLAAFFVFQEDFDKAFVAAASGAVCWFLNYRQQIREKLPKEEGDQEQEDEATDEDLHS